MSNGSPELTTMRTLRAHLATPVVDAYPRQKGTKQAHTKRQSLPYSGNGSLAIKPPSTMMVVPEIYAE